MVAEANENSLESQHTRVNPGKSDKKYHEKIASSAHMQFIPSKDSTSFRTSIGPHYSTIATPSILLMRLGWVAPRNARVTHQPYSLYIRAQRALRQQCGVNRNNSPEIAFPRGVYASSRLFCSWFLGERTWDLTRFGTTAMVLRIQLDEDVMLRTLDTALDRGKTTIRCASLTSVLADVVL